jgi:peptidoglycan/LPS O-acetylase OafA/YrhL
MHQAALPTIHPVKAPRLVQLDALRGIAILLVLFRHPVIVSDSPSVSIWWPIARALQTFGWTGVDLFFVLSGFLVGGLLFNEIHRTGRLDVRRFLIRRGFKIWPSYFLLIGFVFLALVVRWHESAWQALHEVLPNLLHVQNYWLNAQWHTARDQTWSLAVEEHFYLALPLFLLLALRWRGRDGRSLPAVPIVALLVIVGCTAFRFIHNGPIPFDFKTHGGYTHIRMDGLFLGVLLAYGHHFHPKTFAHIARRRAVLLFVGAALVAPMFFIDLERYFVWTIGFTMLYVGYGCILVAVIHATPESGWLGHAFTSRPARALAWVGVFSYPIYLWMFDLGHGLVMHHLVHRVRPNFPVVLHWPILNGTYIAMAILGGATMSVLVERPALALREWLFPSRTSGALARTPEPEEISPAPADAREDVVAVSVN